MFGFNWGAVTQKFTAQSATAEAKLTQALTNNITPLKNLNTKIASTDTSISTILKEVNKLAREPISNTTDVAGNPFLEGGVYVMQYITRAANTSDASTKGPGLLLLALRVSEADGVQQPNGRIDYPDSPVKFTDGTNTFSLTTDDMRLCHPFILPLVGTAAPTSDAKTAALNNIKTNVRSVNGNMNTISTNLKPALKRIISDKKDRYNAPIVSGGIYIRRVQAVASGAASPLPALYMAKEGSGSSLEFTNGTTRYNLNSADMTPVIVTTVTSSDVSDTARKTAINAYKGTVNGINNSLKNSLANPVKNVSVTPNKYGAKDKNGNVILDGGVYIENANNTVPSIPRLLIATSGTSATTPVVFSNGSAEVTGVVPNTCIPFILPTPPSSGASSGGGRRGRTRHRRARGRAHSRRGRRAHSRRH